MDVKLFEKNESFCNFLEKRKREISNGRKIVLLIALIVNN